MRKSLGVVLIILTSVILIVGLAVFGKQREQSVLQAQSELYTSHNLKGQSTMDAKSSNRADKQTAESKIGRGRQLAYFAMGDDIAAGHYTTLEKDSYPYLVANNLHKKLGFKVRMGGVWRVGATIGTGGLPNIDRAVNQHPDVVTLEYGNNEQSVAGSSVTLFRSNLTTAVRSLKTRLPKAKIILITPWAQDIAYRQAVLRVGQDTDTKVIDISSIRSESDTSATSSTKSWAGIVSGAWPNDAGSAKIAAAIEETVAKLYK